MVQTSAYDYINVLNKAANAAWQRNIAISNNISNSDTPGYKRQDVAFESELNKALGRADGNNMDIKVAQLNRKLDRINPRPYTDLENFSYRLDGNNVDPDTEGVMLAENQIKYQGLIDSMTVEFQNLKAVMK